MKIEILLKFLRAFGGHLLAVVALVLAIVALVLAHPARTITETHWTKLVAGASGGRAKLVRTFAGPDGLTGLVISGTQPGVRPVIGWGIPGAKPLVVIAPLYQRDGHDLTAQASAQQLRSEGFTDLNTATGSSPVQAPPSLALTRAPLASTRPTPSRAAASDSTSLAQPPSAAEWQSALRALNGLPATQHLPPDAFLAATQRLTGITVGHGLPVLYVYFDPNCPFCHTLYTTLEPIASRLSVRWIPVAILAASSGPRGAAILQGGPKALAYNEHHFSRTGEEGGIAPSRDKTTALAVARNTLTLTESGASSLGTPTLVWKDRRGVHVVVGVPAKEQLASLIESLEPRT